MIHEGRRTIVTNLVSAGVEGLKGHARGNLQPVQPYSSMCMRAMPVALLYIVYITVLYLGLYVPAWPLPSLFVFKLNHKRWRDEKMQKKILQIARRGHSMNAVAAASLSRAHRSSVAQLRGHLMRLHPYLLLPLPSLELPFAPLATALHGQLSSAAFASPRLASSEIFCSGLFGAVCATPSRRRCAP